MIGGYSSWWRNRDKDSCGADPAAGLVATCSRRGEYRLRPHRPAMPTAEYLHPEPLPRAAAVAWKPRPAALWPATEWRPRPGVPLDPANGAPRPFAPPRPHPRIVSFGQDT